MKTLIAPLRNEKQADLFLKIFKKMGVKAKLYSEEEMEDFALAKHAQEALNEKEELPVEELYEYLRKQGVEMD
ncbi:MAG: hypothetical protein HY063_02030 [Bacteroidetes bacterium]|nr:hypothetical protein [Bacteroidota bacterium]